MHYDVNLIWVRRKQTTSCCHFVHLTNSLLLVIYAFICPLFFLMLMLICLIMSHFVFTFLLPFIVNTCNMCLWNSRISRDRQKCRRSLTDLLRNFAGTNFLSSCRRQATPQRFVSLLGLTLYRHCQLVVLAIEQEPFNYVWSMFTLAQVVCTTSKSIKVAMRFQLHNHVSAVSAVAEECSCVHYAYVHLSQATRAAHLPKLNVKWWERRTRAVPKCSACHRHLPTTLKVRDDALSVRL